jgi:hypothetical protein
MWSQYWKSAGGCAKLYAMERSDKIAAINIAMDGLDDLHLTTVSDAVIKLGDSAPKPLRELSARERALPEASKRDFEAGQTLTLEESEAEIFAMLAEIDASTPLAS